MNAQLYEIDKRFLVVSSESDALPTPTLGPAAAALRVDVDTSLVAKVAPNALPPKLVGEISSADGALVFRLAPR